MRRIEQQLTAISAQTQTQSDFQFLLRSIGQVVIATVCIQRVDVMVYAADVGVLRRKKTEENSRHAKQGDTDHQHKKQQ